MSTLETVCRNWFLEPFQALSVKELMMKYNALVHLWTLQNCEILSSEFLWDWDILFHSYLWSPSHNGPSAPLHLSSCENPLGAQLSPWARHHSLPFTVTSQFSASSASVCMHLLISDCCHDKHHILQESVEPLVCSLFRQEYVHMVWAGADAQSDYQAPLREPRRSLDLFI